MTQVLILHCDGTQSRATMHCAQDYSKAVRGPHEPLAHQYSDGERCYVNEQAILRSLQCNHWSPLLRAMGFLPQGTLRGDVVLCSSDVRGFDCDVSHAMMENVNAFVTTENRAATLQQIESKTRANAPIGKPHDYADWMTMTRVRRKK